MSTRIAKPQLDEEEIAAVSRVIRSGMIACGPETALFEQEFADFIGCKFACAVNNGTAALSLALLACGIGPGDEVITSPFTFVATGNAILSCGAIPVFADIDEASFNLSPKSVESMISENTKAIMPVHLYGLAAEMNDLQNIADENNLYLIGDAAQAHGAEINGQKVGTFGDIECFSFYPTKNMTTGEGGMATTNDEELYNNLISIRNHGRPDSQLGVYDHERFGLNLRMTDISSAIGRVQLKKLPDFNHVRARNAKVLSSSLNDLAGIMLPIEPNGRVHAWHQYTIRLKNREQLANYLNERGIETRSYYPKLIYDYPHLKKFNSDCVVARKVANEVLSLPIHAGVLSEQLEIICNSIISWHRNQKV